jgi:hypothetical protein
LTVEVGVKPKRLGELPPRAVTHPCHADGPFKVKQGCQRSPSANPVPDQEPKDQFVTTIATEKNLQEIRSVSLALKKKVDDSASLYPSLPPPDARKMHPALPYKALEPKAEFAL